MCKKFLMAGVMLAVLTCGCDAARYTAWLWFGESNETMPAEFDELAGSKVAVVIYADQKTSYHHRYLQSELSLAVRQELVEQIKGIEVIPSSQVLRYQAQNLYWDSMDRAQLARELGADYVLLISVLDFRTRRPGSQHLYQGYLLAEASVWDAALPESRARLWYCPDLSATWPEQPSMGRLGQDDRRIRYRTQKIFADLLAKKFYKHKVPRRS